MIYDCFTFFNELELLKIRLNILNHYVDRFVIVESTWTHSGKPKELVFEKNKHLFAEFLPRIEHIIVDDKPDLIENAWTLERFQRNAIRRGLSNLKKGDRVLISDVDEIPDPKAIQKWSTENAIVIFKQKMFYYYLNCVNAGKSSASYTWCGTTMAPAEYFDQPQDLRDISIMHLGLETGNWKSRLVYFYTWLKDKRLRQYPVKLAEHGGWHFSYLGGTQRIIDKLEAFAHQEYNQETYKNPQVIEQAIRDGKDLFGRGFTYKFIPIDDTFPEYLVSNKNEFKELIR
jgi:beta-1,4-mannosyl-glycoprotein beta-1,4-N-acetylglucosaminyltransferase